MHWLLIERAERRRRRERLSELVIKTCFVSSYVLFFMWALWS